MLSRTTQPFAVWFTLTDLAATACAWVGAYLLRFSGWLPIPKPEPGFDACLQNLPLVLVLALAAYRVAGLYRIHRMRRFREELIAVGKGCGLLVLFVMAARFYRQDTYESRTAMTLFMVLTPVGVLSARRLSWAGLKSLRSRGYNQTNAIIVGTGRVARNTARSLKGAGWMGIRTLGFIEDQPNRWCDDLPILGTTADLPRLVAENDVEHVFIALPLNRYGDARRVFDILSQTFAEVRLVVDAPEMAGLSLTTTNLDGLPIIGLRESAHFGLNLIVKRAMDIALTAVGLVLISPLLALLAALVKWSSPGPVFYRQERCGLNGQPFQMLKFRTMPVDAEAGTGPVWAVKNDPRRTRLGAFLRQTSLDELPQLFNVLKGDMSLVGPRPERPHFIAEFEKTIPNYMARHKVKAGITGWAQVHGWRGNTSLRKRVQYDLYYITHWNPWLDIKILAMTILRINKNAY
ncbi:MAG: undecaprenyl-phosphate glucose phosphotransferase [Gemmataceae bacterium]|nr:undecaprenyl-phosphate glucose phosphotransferase [Gemmataceae bacterium]